MKALMSLLLAGLTLASTAFAATSNYEFDCNALSAATQEGGQAKGSFTIENGKGNAGFSYPPMDQYYVIQVLYKVDLNTKGASSVVLQVSDMRNPNAALASANSILHFDGTDQVALKYNLQDKKSEISIQCSLRSAN